MRPSDLIRFKQSGRAITVLTAWDSLSASWVEAAGADAVLVGDSLAMVALGHATTLPVTLEQMLQNTLAVQRGFRAMQKAAQEQAKQPKAKKSDSVQIKQSISKNCPKKANPDIFWLGL